MSVGFIMTRHVNSEMTNRYWQDCYRSIRRFYSSAIILIIDDNSDLSFVRIDDDLVLENCFFIRSEFPRCGEFLGYYYFHKYRPFKKAVILHDSVFFQRYIDFQYHEPFRSLWHFVQHHWDDEVIEIGLLSTLRYAEELIAFYHQKNRWYGSFGQQAVCTLEWIDRMEDKYGFLGLVHHIRDRQTRSCMERIVGCVAAKEDPSLCSTPSLFGAIFSFLPWGYSYDDYRQDRQDCTSRAYRLPIIKVWTSR
jgi:hypothetical protein